MSLELCQGPRRRGAAWVQVGVPAGHLLSAVGAPENLHSSEGGWDQEGASCQDWRARGLDGTWRGTALGQSSGTLEQGGCQFTRKPARPCVQTRCLESPEEPSPYPRDKPGAVLWGTRTDGRGLSPGSMRAMRGSSSDACCGFMGLKVMRGCSGGTGGPRTPLGEPLQGQAPGWQGQRPRRATLEG